MATQQKRKRIVCTLQKKLEVIQRLDNGESVQKLSSELGIGVTTIKDWRKNRKNIESYSMTVEGEEGLKNRKMLKKPKFDVLDDALWIWFCQERRKGTPLSGPIIKEKAAILHKTIVGEEGENFSASEGWLHRWKRRHGIRHVVISGEKLSADDDATKEFVKKFEVFIKENNMHPDQVYNIDESGLNYKMLPQKTLAAKNEKVTGTKLSKDRLTFATCSNASGNHKMPLFVIGKSKKPRAFKHVNMASLPVYYKNQKSAWMDSSLFKQWFFEEFVPDVKKHLKMKNLPLNAVLILDNAPSHPSENELTMGNIKAMFLPPRVTPLIQPMDQGVIEWLKKRYRRKYVSFLLEQTEGGSNLFEAMKTFNIKDAIYIAAQAWDELNHTTLQKSWRKLWPSIIEGESAISNESETLNTDEAEILQDLQTIDAQIQPADIEEWLLGGDIVEVTNEDLNDEQIVSAVFKVETEEDETDDEKEEPENISHTTATEAFEIAMKYVEQHPEATPMDVLCIKKWKDISAKARFGRLKQKNITDFFK